MGIASKIVKGGLEAVAKKARRAEDLERKAAEAYAQMPEYLQDPYLGLSTSNIGKVTKSILAKAPRMSKAELEASGYYHPIGRGLKLSKPAQEYTADIIDDPNMPLVPKNIVTPEDLYGKVGIPLVGDRSDTGKLLRGIEGVTFDKPVGLEGGHKFGRAHQYKNPKVSSVWASDPGVVTALNNQIKRAAESGKDVLGVSSMGSPEMVDYNTMIAQSVLNMTDLGGIHPKAIEAFNDEIKNLAKKNKETGKVTTPFQNFLGIDHPEVTTQLLSKNAGELRKAFIRTMEKDQYRKLGFPELAPIRKAIINPEILDMPLGSTGLDIYKMSPEGSIVEAPKNPHSTYPVHMQGEYFGGLEDPIDYKNMFSTFYEPKKLLSVPDRHAYRAYSLSAPIQEFNQQWLDEVMPIYQQKIKDITGRKKGGEIHPDGSPRLANGASARKMVKYILKDQKFGFGGIAKKIVKKAVKELPEASASGKTPIATTVGTYRKASPILLEDIKDVNAPILDYGAGMGLGAEELRKTFPNVKTLEPFYEGKFDFTDPSKVPSGEFKGLTNFSVLNAVTPEVRDSIVENIGRVMDRGGVGLITARSPSAVMSTKGKLVDEPNAMITQKGTYQKGFDTDELREYIKYILGSDFEYEPLKGLSGTSVKVKKKADGGSIDEPEVLKEIPRGKISGKIADILKPASEFLGKYEVLPQIPLIGGTSVAELTGVEGIQTLADDISRGYRPIRNLERGKLQTSFFDPRLVDAVDLGTTALGGVGLAKNLGKTAIKEGMKQIETGTGMLGRNVMNPRMNVIKDQGGMLVGGEKALDDELIAIKKNENPYPHAHQYFVPEAERANLKDKNAVALNSWVDTKVKKYIRNQAGSEADPILKAIDSGVDYNFTPPQSGDTKYTIAMKRKLVGKDPQGIATTERGKDWEYTVDSIFNPVKSSEIKDILQRNKDLPPSEASDKFLASVLRMEHDLPVYNKKDLDALQLINQIPDETVYGLNPAITNKLGLNHMTDVIMSDLESGRLKPEQLNQMSMEKAIRRVAEFDAEQAKIASKAEADTIKDLPIYNTYDQGYKWIELNHPTDELITRKALTSESDQMGHCVGRLAKYREGIENGTKRIYSLRDANNKPHITIEEDIYRNPDAFVKANAETIANDPDLSKIQYSDDVDYRYGDARLTDDELNNNFIGELIRTMKKKGLPINEDPSTTYSIINQVKGKENTRPNEKYQSYLTDFLKNSPIKHEIAEIKELQNTNILDIDKIGQHGIVPKEVHFHPVVESAVKNYPKENILSTFGKLDMKPSKMEVDEAIKYQMFKDVAHDLAIQKNYYPTNEDVISHIKNKYLPTQKAKGGSINLNQEYKLENMRRRYG
jgi:hypothetical protein